MKNTKNQPQQKQSVLKNILFKFLYPATAYYTVITMFFYLCGVFFDLSDRHMVLTRSSAFLILLFSFVAVAANLLLKTDIPKLHIAVKIFIHYVLYTLSFFFIFIKIAEYDAGTSSTIILVLVFSVIYFLICGIVFAIRGALKKSENASSDYRSIYGE